jgi:hypothetical protein
MGMEAAQGIAGFLTGFGQRYGEIEDRRMRQDQIDLQRQGIDLQKQTAADDRAFRQRQYEDLKAARDHDYSRQQTMDSRTEEQYQSKLVTANMVRDLYEHPNKADEIGPTLAFHASRAGMNVGEINNWLKEVKGVRETGLGDAFKDAYTMNFDGAIAKQNKVADKFGVPRWQSVSGDPKSGFVFTYDDGRQEEVKPFDAAIRMTSYGYNPKKLIEEAQSAVSPEKRKGQAVDLGDRVQFVDPETGTPIGDAMNKGIPAGKEPRDVESAGDKRKAEAIAKKIELNDKRTAQLQDIEMPQVSAALQQAMSTGDEKATAQSTQQLRLLRSRIDSLNKERESMMESLNGDNRVTPNVGVQRMGVPGGLGATGIPERGAQPGGQGIPAGGAPQQQAQQPGSSQSIRDQAKGDLQFAAKAKVVPPPNSQPQPPQQTNAQLSKYLDIITGQLPEQGFSGNIGGSTIPAAVGNPLVGAVKGIGYAKAGYNNSDANFSQKVAELRSNPVFIKWLEDRQKQNPRLPTNANDLVAEFMQSIRSAQ